MTTPTSEVEANQELLAELDEMDYIPGKPTDTDTDDTDTDDDLSGGTNEETDEETQEETEDLQTEEIEGSDDNIEGEGADDEESTTQENANPEETDVTDKDKTEVTDKTNEVETIEALRAEINNLNSAIMNMQKPAQPDTELKEAPKAVPETPIEKSSTDAILKPELSFGKDYDFFQGKNPDDVIDDPKQFTGLLMDFANQVSQKTQVQTMLAIPAIVKHHSALHAEITRTVDKFYTTNDDLIPIKATVSQVANQVAAEHSDWEMQKVFDEAAVRTRKMLRLVKQSKKGKKGNGNRLETDGTKTNIGKNSQRKGKFKNTSLTPLQKELDAL